MLRREILVMAVIWCQVGCSRNEGSLCDPDNEIDFSALGVDITGVWRPSSGDDVISSVEFDATGAPASVNIGEPPDWTFGCDARDQFPLELGATNETPGPPTEGGGKKKTLALADIYTDGYVLEWLAGTANVEYRMELVVVDDEHINFDFVRASDVALRPYVRDDSLSARVGSGVEGVE
jgi:hypothetical protein